MKVSIGLFFVSIIFLFNAQAAQLHLFGHVGDELEVEISDQIKFLGNSEFIVESQDSSGQIHRVFLQYNKQISLPKKNIKKVIVYAP